MNHPQRGQVQIQLCNTPHIGVLSYCIPPFASDGKRAKPMLRISVRKDDLFYLEHRTENGGWVDLGHGKAVDTYVAMAQQHNQMLAATNMKQIVRAQQIPIPKPNGRDHSVRR